jgi:orotate phosphoribosyltransferase
MIQGMSATVAETVAQTLFEIGAVRFGRFVLHSGRVSPIYLDLRLLVSHPEALRRVARAYREQLEPLAFDRLAATPLSGLPIGTAVALEMDRPLIYPRKQAKGYGTGNEIEGKWQVGETAVVLDDLITSGDSLLETITSLKASGLRVTDAVVLVDREQGGRTALLGQGYQLHRVLDLSHLLAILESHDHITGRQRANVLKALQIS